MKLLYFSCVAILVRMAGCGCLSPMCIFRSLNKISKHDLAFCKLGYIKGLLYAIYSHEIPDHLDNLLDWIIFALFIAPTLQVIFSAYLKLTFVFNYHNPLEFDDKDILKVARGLILTLTIGAIGLLIHFEDQKGKENRVVTLAIFKRKYFSRIAPKFQNTVNPA